MDNKFGCRTFGFKGAGFSSMRHPLHRYYGQGDLPFVTFSCYHRQPLLGSSEARNIFVKNLDEVRKRHAFRLIGYVVMPEHVHLLLSEPKNTDPSKVLQVLKQKTSLELHELSKAFWGRGAVDGALWQRRFYDFNVYSTEKIGEKLEYMHANPVVRKLAPHPKDWPWSSWSHYALGEEGLLRIDSIGEEKIQQGSTFGDGKKSQNPHP